MFFVELFSFSALLMMSAKWASVRSLPASRPASLFVRRFGGMAVLLALVWAALGVFGLRTVERGWALRSFGPRRPGAR